MEAAQSTISDFIHSLICDKEQYLTMFDADRMKKIMNHYCFIGIFRKGLEFEIVQSLHSRTIITREWFNSLS